MMAKTKITFKSKVCEFLIDCLKQKFPDMKFSIEILDPNQNENTGDTDDTDEADKNVEDEWKYIYDTAVIVYKEMCTKFRPVQFDFFESKRVGLVNTDAINPIAPSALNPFDLNQFVALLEVRVFTTSKIPIHNAIKSWIAKGILSTVYSNRSKSVGVKRNLVGQKVLQINV
jgi:disulfide oxidoreductase YuzD